MAEALARKAIAEKLGVGEDELEKRGITVMSAGSFATPGAKATPQGVEALREIGIDLTRHRSRPLSVELIHQADRIFTMGRSHAAAVASLVPGAGEKTSTLNPEGEIDDPIGGDLALYQALTGRLRELIQQQVIEGFLDRQEQAK
jgi:protein-tyrosine phosphatase